jgi:hypothetical protein
MGSKPNCPWCVIWRGVDSFSPSSWEPQEEGMMSTAASFSLRKKPSFIESRKKSILQKVMHY